VPSQVEAGSSDNVTVKACKGPRPGPPKVLSVARPADCLACKEAGIVDQTFYRWRKNAQLRCAMADLTVEKQILKDIAQGNY
jgi:hypothetical protein